jgi:hypothetical protein
MVTTRLAPHDLPTRLRRILSDLARSYREVAAPELWHVVHDGRVHGVLSRDGCHWTLAWTDVADPRLVAFGGPLVGEADDIGAALVRHLAATAPAGTAGAETLRLSPVLAV